MDNVCTGYSPFAEISWMWYAIAVVVAYAIGALWYGVLFSKTWIKAVRYECPCGADIKNGEKCTCKNQSALPMIFQFITTALIGLMYFILTDISIWLSVIVVIAVCGWMKSNLKFQIAEWKRFFTLASLDVGYFFIASAIFVLFALI